MGLVYSGALDSFSLHGGVNRTLFLKSSTFYFWLSIVLLLVWRCRRNWGKEMLLAGASVIATLFLAEIAVRSLFPSVALPAYRLLPSNDLHHISPSSSRMFHGQFDDTEVVVSTNADGLRSDYQAKSFATGNPRILVLGDSFTFGWGVNEVDAFPAVLEVQLRAAGYPRANVLNAGVVSYSPYLEYQLLKRIGKKYRPTIVLLFLDVTDVGDDYQYMDEAASGFESPNYSLAESIGLPYDVSRNPEGGVGLVRLLPQREILLFPFSVIRERVGEGRPEPPIPKYDYYKFQVNVGGKVDSSRFFIYRHPLAATKPFFYRTLKNIQRVRDFSQSIEAQFHLVVLPRYHHWNLDECPDNWEQGYNLDEPYQFEFFEFFGSDNAAIDFPVFELLPEFQTIRDFPLVFEHDPHWNAAGHRFVAQATLNYLLSSTFVIKH